MLKNLALIFMTMLSWQVSIFAQTYIQENFDAGLPGTWVIGDGGNTADTWMGTTGGLSGFYVNSTASEFMIANSDAAGSGSIMNDTITTPAFNSSAGATVYVDFSHVYESYAFTDVATVEVFDGTTWQVVATFAGANVGAFGAPDLQHIDITAHKNAAMQVRFTYSNADWEYWWAIDDVHIYATSCPAPTGLGLNALTTTTADLAWTAGGTETMWDVEWGTTGFTQGAGTMVAPTDTFTQITGLTSNTSYSFYVRANCGASQSAWVGPFTFTTSCDAFVAPYTEGFEDPANLSCWSVARSSANYSWFLGSGQTPTGALGNETGPDGASIPAVGTDTGYIFAEASAPAAPNDIARFQSPTIDLTALTTPELRFEYHMAGADITTLYIQVDNGTGYVVVDSIVGAQQTLRSDPWLTKVVDLSAFSGNIQIGFLTFRGASFNGDCSIDDISVDNAPAPPVADLIISEIMYNTPGVDTAEFIEIYNNGTMPVDLTGYTMGGVAHTFAGGTIAAGDYFVITMNSADFNTVYGFAADDQWTSGNLVNSSEFITIHDNLGRLVDSVMYDDAAPWDTHSDGLGSSLVLCDTTADNNDGTNWSRSYTNANTTINGVAIFASPGAANNCTAPVTSDVSVSTFLGLDNSYCNVATVTGQVVITNNTANPETNVPYTISVVGVGPIGGGVIPSLGGNASDTITVGPVPLATTGIYTISVYTSMLTDGNTANDTLMQTIAVSNTTAAISGSTDVNCNGGMDGMATATGANGLGAYTFMWTPSGQTTSMATGLAANTYEVIVSDTSNCADTTTVTITEPTAVDASVVDNGNGSATASAVGGTGTYSFVWDNGATTATATGLTSGMTHCVSVTDVNNCEDTACVFILVTGLDDIQNTASAFKVYPNPTTGNVFVELGLSAPADVQLSIYNAIGENVMTRQLKGQSARIELNTGELPTGVYMMRFAVDNEISTQKLIIQRP